MNVLICVFMVIFACVNVNGLQVVTTEGVVEGYKAKDGEYYEFYGIPYAGRTDGINRFKAPKPPAPHPEVFHANLTDIICAQPSEKGLIGVENCLTLSIFTNNVTISKPVIVWLNAEDYTTTTTKISSFRTFVKHNLVFVSLNFRLSIFGFLCLGIQEAPGNAGLRDVIQGLKWINANIINFGGNPNNVVLMGHASGAAMVDLITMAPQAEGLIHKAIALSGSALAPWAVAFDPVGYAEMLGAKLGYTGKTKKDLAEHLILIDINLLGLALSEFLHFKNNTPLFAPCIENIDLSPSDTLLSAAPIKLINSRKYLQIPYITGYTSREGTMRAREAIYGDWITAMNENFTTFLPVDLALSNIATKHVAAAITKNYFQDYESLVNFGNLDDYFKYMGDTLVTTSVIKGANDRGLTSTAEVRLFIFGYLGTYNSDWPYKQFPLNGVRHGAILNYLFDYDLRPADKHVMKSILQRFATFAYTGSQITTDDMDEWLPITRYHLFTYFFTPSTNIGSFMVDVIDHLHGATMELWTDLYKIYYKFPTSVADVNSSEKLTYSTRIVFNTVIFILLSRLV